VREITIGCGVSSAPHYDHFDSPPYSHTATIQTMSRKNTFSVAYVRIHDYNEFVKIRLEAD